ncbi:class I SAM-dependent methyltransferase [Clostridium sp. chh4-2]|uniref:class I SAM-dependent methyltransferase n=1 Tax=Clostridium sp. chh4-2 TaxID=2067550 RepID=UPI0015E185F3|nr:class I SAM-dependent methyltransferase [Clostridium sp. chh4-2]
MEIKERIEKYWSRRAEEFSQARLADLNSSQKDMWLNVITSYLPEKDIIKALDLGTGAGFYAFLLKDLGCEVTGIDYSPAMIEEAEKNSSLLGYGDDIHFLQMDAQKLEFADESFDFIISRNVTWTLPDPRKAYEEMCRVLTPGGRILNFDANYGQAFAAADEAGLTEEQRKWSSGGYEYTPQSMDMIRERNDIAKSLSICSCIRPQWDVDVLLKNGMQKIWLDVNFGNKIYGDKKVYGNSFEPEKKKTLPTAPIFMVGAQK